MELVLILLIILILGGVLYAGSFDSPESVDEEADKEVSEEDEKELAANQEYLEKTKKEIEEENRFYGER